MSKEVIITVVEKCAEFAMAHPVAATVIVVSTVVVGGAIYLGEKYLENNRNNDEDRSLGNRRGIARNN